MKLKAVLAASFIAALLSAPIAHAESTEEQAYLDSLAAFGLEVYDPSAAIQTGYWVCSQLSVASGEVVVANVQARYYSDLPTIAWAQAQVLAALFNLCPSHWHPGRAT